LICAERRKILTHSIGVRLAWAAGDVLGIEWDYAVHSAKETAPHPLYHQGKVKSSKKY